MTVCWLLLVLSGVARAGEGGPVAGVGGGYLVTDPGETILSTWRVGPRLGWRLDDHWSVEADVGFGQGQTRLYARRFNLLSPLASVVLRLPIPGPVDPLLTTSAGLAWRFVDVGEAADRTVAPVDAAVLLGGGPGLGVQAGPVFIHADGRYLASVGGVPRGPEESVFFGDWLVSLGVDFTPGAAPADRDSDGIPIASDACPDAPEDVDGYRDRDGCPDPDNDDDDIPDATDQCPDEAEDFDGLADEDGCKDWDFDGDGVLDAEDGCPEDPEDVDGNLDSDGCPDVDDDADGVPDIVDPCPRVPGPFDASGCPDADADHVPDFRDSCPDDAVDLRADPAFSDGCPSSVLVGTGELILVEPVTFEGDTAAPDAAARPVLDQVARALAAWPALRKVEIAVMVPGDEDLATRRAQAVVGYLEGEGVRSDRLVARGVSAGLSAELVIRIVDRRR